MSSRGATKMSSQEITPDISSGIQRMAPLVIQGWAILTSVYLVLRWFMRPIASWIHLPPPSPEFCRDHNKNNSNDCLRGDLFAFQLSSCLAFTTCAVMGFSLWHVSRRAHTMLPATPAGRLFGYLPEIETLVAINFCFQFWDFVVSLIIPEHATAIFLLHHFMASVVSFCSIRYQLLHYYGVFFLGLSEMSSFFLVFLDLSKFFPPEPNSFYERWVMMVCGPFFVVFFFYYRVLLWWPESYRLFCDVRAVVANGQAEKLRPGATWVLYVFLALNLPLGLLQLYWTTLIAEEVRNTVKTIIPLVYISNEGSATESE